MADEPVTTAADETDESERRGAAALADSFLRLLPRLRRLGARHHVDGDDLAQDACLRLLRLDAPEAVEQPARYLSSVARNLLIDRHRARAREARVLVSGLDPEMFIADSAANPEQVLAGKQRLALVMAAIAELPPRCSEAFHLHRFHGLTYVEIARQMGISASGVEKHIAEALERLDRALARGEGLS